MDTERSERPIRVLIADDQASIREGLELLLGLSPDIEAVGRATDGDDAVRMVGEHTPDVVLMDLRMPRCDGFEATRQIARHHLSTLVMVLTTFADAESTLRTLEAGAMGSRTKDVGARAIQGAIRTVHAGEVLLDPSIQRRLIPQLRGTAPVEQTSYCGGGER
jgi:DNA-binding NarL/FixJ family response regulator